MRVRRDPGSFWGGPESQQIHVAPPGGLLDACWSNFGGFLESWGAVWRIGKNVEKNPRTIKDLGLPEGVREPLGVILGGPGGVLEPLEGFVGAASSQSHLEASWNPLGRVLDRLGRVWKPSWSQETAKSCPEALRTSILDRGWGRGAYINMWIDSNP